MGGVGLFLPTGAPGRGVYHTHIPDVDKDKKQKLSFGVLPTVNMRIKINIKMRNGSSSRNIIKIKTTKSNKSKIFERASYDQQ